MLKMSAVRLLILSLILFTNVFCKNDSGSSEKNVINGVANEGKNQTSASRSKRTLDDVYNLVKDDDIYIILLCDMCALKYKCEREYCKICGDCMNQELPPAPEITIHEKQHSNDEETCSYCLTNGCKNTKACHKCSVCHGK